MTNTSDFRRYSYAGDTAYLIESFNYTRATQAPKLRPQEEPERGFKVRENTKAKSREELRKEQKLAFARAVKIAAAAIVCLLMIAFVLHSFAVKNELTREISSVQTDIANAQSENISLQSELNAMVSMSSIDTYAVEQLGMVKVKSNQIQYMNVDEFKASREKALADKHAKEATLKTAPKGNK